MHTYNIMYVYVYIHTCIDMYIILCIHIIACTSNLCYAHATANFTCFSANLSIA